ncbi:MAG TPA: hypothetical protein VJQ56_08545 [Blastocatellia bacterium]|nr:hypothetical protein [Blastocatellia bacterium]
MKKSFSIAVMTLLVIVTFLFAKTDIGFGQAGEREVTLAGEVVDLHCYATRHGKDGRGAEHAGCANSCISRGVTVGFISDDGKLYVLFDEKMIAVKEKVAGLAGQPVAVTGVVVERDGLKAIRVIKVEPAKKARGEGPRDGGVS